MRTRIEHEIFRYLLLAGSRVFASSRGNHMATQRLPKNDGIMADCSLRPGNRFLSDELKTRAHPFAPPARK